MVLNQDYGLLGCDTVCIVRYKYLMKMKQHISHRY